MPLVGSRFTSTRRRRKPAAGLAQARIPTATRTAPAEGPWRRAVAAYLTLADAFDFLGGWISTHQTLSLLATALVICSLLSPAILVTFSPSGSFLDVSTSAITRRGRGEFLWELEGMARQGLISTEEEVCWDRVKLYYARTGREGGGTRIRVEQILIPVGTVGSTTSSRATITKAALHRVWRVQRELEHRLQTGRIPGNACVRNQTPDRPGCAVLSPASWWSDEAALLRDPDVHRTLSTSPEAADRLPVTLSNTLVGIGRDRHNLVKTAQQVIVTFLLEEPTVASSALAASLNATLEDSVTGAAAAAWRAAVHEVVEHRDWQHPLAGYNSRDPIGVASESKAPTRHVILKYLPQLVIDPNPRLLENAIYGVGYALVLVYVSRFVRKLRAHSKLGLLATGFVELVASGIMSVSICWLFGWGLSLVPWNLLAFMVLASGLDNMIVVLRAIADTDVNLPVPRRMSSGLRRVGAEMTILLVVEELMALGLLWWVEITVMREWIRFGAVVLVVDYFLELTFFSTVLSIDIQRLELADLLTQNTAPPYKPLQSSAEARTGRDSSGRHWSAGSIARAAWKVLRDRPAKTSTVAFLWVINVFLWTSYGSEHYLPAACSQTALSPDRPFLAPALSPALTRSLRLGRGDSASSSHAEVSPGVAAAFWKLVNPRNSTSVQLYLEPPISIQFLDDGALAAPESLDVLLPHEPTSSLVAKIGVVLMPIAVVMGLLQILLVYLLKDAELLQAHWGSEERLGGKLRSGRRRHSTLSPRNLGIEAIPSSKNGLRHDSDVELFASSDTRLASWSALQPTVAMYRRYPEGLRHIFDVRLADADLSPTLIRLALSSDGHYFGALDTEGRLGVWRLAEGSSSFLPLPEDRPVSRVVALAAISASPTRDAPGEFIASPSSDDANSTIGTESSPTFVTVHVDGSAYTWSFDAERSACHPVREASLQEAVTWKALPRSASLLSGVTGDGSILLLSLDSRSPGAYLRLSNAGGDPIEIVTRLAPIASGPHDLVAAARRSGAIELYDLAQGQLIGQVDAFEGRVQRIELRPSCERRKCPWCAAAIQGGGLLVASSRTHLKVFEVFAPPNSADEDCLCRSHFGNHGPPVSPTLSRVASMNTPTRRFSPRKKPITPVRPPQPVFSTDSSLKPPLPPPARSSSSSNSSSPERERRNGFGASIAEPPPRSAPPSPRVSPSLPPISLPPLIPVKDVPVTMNEDSRERRSRAEAADQLKVVEVASLALGGRGRWCVAGGHIVGVRRSAELVRDELSCMEDHLAWEVWSLTLGEEGGPFDAGFAESSAPLGDILPATIGEAVYSATPAEPTSRAAEPASNADEFDHSLLRKRRTSTAPADTAGTLDRVGTALPFSHIRPLVSVFGDRVTAAGLGNRILLLRATQGTSIPAVRASNDGFLGL